MRRTYLYKAVLSVVFIVSVNSILLSQTGVITGKVKYGNEVLQAATVSIDNKIILTDHHGEFSFSVKPGNYTLTITHAGYKKIEQAITIEAGSTRNFVFEMIPEEQLGEIVLLGSRSLVQRSNLSTPVPVDAFSSEKLLQTGQQGLIQMLNYTAPSFNASRQFLNEPITLRGLDPDHLLILINGIRYHNTAWLNNGNPKSVLGRGSAGNDLNSIPFSAIEKIEILRDGASAQFGSDAIAGVMNIRLKETTGKTSIQLNTGQFYAGDGLKFSVGINSGIRINKKGFLNYSVDFMSRSPTSRGGEYGGTVYRNYPSNATHADSIRIKAQDDSIILAKGISRKTFLSNDGISEINSSGFLLNGGYMMNNRVELFCTGAVNYLENGYIGSYRFPKNTNQVDTVLFPDGFKPEPKIKNTDISVIAGLKGDTKKRWHWEFSNSFGNNTSKNSVSNTNNASMFVLGLGKNAPTTFYVGKLVYNQYSSNISFTKDLAGKKDLFKLFNFSFGAEWRWENWKKKEGEEASWKNYDPSFNKQTGSQSFVGFNPLNSVNKNRNVSAAYADFEMETKDHFLFDLVGRYEYYNDFGGNLAGKLAVRYKFSEKFSLRGAISNGFRAPGLQQYYYGGTQVSRIAGTAVLTGIFSNNSNVTKAFGIPPLQAERSVNLVGGFTSKLSRTISLTVDAYWIQIKNRIVLSGTFTKDNPDVRTILVNYPGIDQVQFYTNAINTRTKGIDAVLNGNWNIGKTKLGLILAANVNHNSLFGTIKTTSKITDTSKYAATLFGIEEKTSLEKSQPDSKIILTATANRGKFGLVFRNTVFGKTATTNIASNPKPIPPDTLYEFFSSKLITDISISYSPKSWLTIMLGANNVFDIYPDRLKNYRNTSEGILVYSHEASPFGINGGYYFISMSFSF